METLFQLKVPFPKLTKKICKQNKTKKQSKLRRHTRIANNGRIEAKVCEELGNTAKRPEDLLAGIKGWEGSFLQQCCRSQSTLSGMRACLEGLAGELTLCNVLEG